ncbi:hypothetical protein [Mycobacterium sp. URHB0044]|uniref:hypothetical protein n=1 Tax=Mycobacterium sp. URHB0044 TaxID=1380386 RepID=UPI00048D9327|nr:hypothetical protein [Mycobacterium sp. URHB0044]
MRINSTLHTALLAGAAVATILAAPMATAAPTPLKDCLVTANGSTCQSPGNVEITDSRPPVNIYPYGTMPFLLGRR